MADFLLHPEILNRTPYYGQMASAALEENAQAAVVATEKISPLGASVIIRTKEDEAHLEGLLEDVETAQQVYGGEVETIVVDTESTDRTREIAKSFGATIVSISQEDFSHPKSLNLGLEAASFNTVFCLVGHSALTTSAQITTSLQYANQPDFGGAYGHDLAGSNATILERYIRRDSGQLLRKPLCEVTESTPGVLVSNRSVLSKAAWREVGGFDNRYGAGAEDFAMATSLLRAGAKVMLDPVLSVHHSHGLGYRGLKSQKAYWQRITQPTEFSGKLLGYRKDL